MNRSEFGLEEMIALKLVRTGSDRINFQILKMVEREIGEKERGTNIGDIVRETGLTKVPVNVRINQLEKVGLVMRWRGTGLVMLTELGKIFMDAVSRGEDIVRERIMEMLNNMYHNR